MNDLLNYIINNINKVKYVEKFTNINNKNCIKFRLKTESFLGICTKNINIYAVSDNEYGGHGHWEINNIIVEEYSRDKKIYNDFTDKMYEIYNNYIEKQKQEKLDNILDYIVK